MSRTELTEVEEAYIHGLVEYAWWKDGTRYVGTTGTTFSDAVVRYLTGRGFDVEIAREIAHRS